MPFIECPFLSIFSLVSESPMYSRIILAIKWEAVLAAWVRTVEPVTTRSVGSLKTPPSSSESASLSCPPEISNVSLKNSTSPNGDINRGISSVFCLHPSSLINSRGFRRCNHHICNREGKEGWSSCLRGVVL